MWDVLIVIVIVIGDGGRDVDWGFLGGLAFGDLIFSFV